MFGERGHCNLSPPPSLLVGFLVVQLVHLLRWMLTVQNSKKSWLPMKSTCRCLADDATLGLRLPPSGSGCPRVPVTREGNGPVCSWLALLSFILCVGLMVSSVQFILSVLSNSLRPHELQHARLPVHSLSRLPLTDEEKDVPARATNDERVRTGPSRPPSRGRPRLQSCLPEDLLDFLSHLIIIKQC